MRYVHVQREAGAPRSAFSLIEVLVSVVVLALGLLGLAAVFPTVVRQQRLASDGVEGASLERSVREWISNHDAMKAGVFPGAVPNQGVYAADERRGWTTLLGDAEWSDMVNTDNSNLPTFWSYQGQWVAPNISSSPAGGINIDPTTGDVVIGESPSYDDTHAAFFAGVPVPLIERLIPTPDLAGSVVPRFVFDFAARRIDVGVQRAANPTDAQFVNFASNDDQIEIAVFVRRIDSSIRVAQGSTLTKVLLGRSVGPNDRRVPVAADAANRPTNDGQGLPGSRNYSGILIANFALEDELTNQPSMRTNRIVLEPVTGLTQPNNVRAIVGLLEQVGQKFVAPDGTVHTVRGISDAVVGTSTVRSLLIDPALSEHVLELAQTDPTQLRMVVTPQVPAAVFVVRP